MNDRYNTYLNPEEEYKFQLWAGKNNRINDTQDYDLRGFYKDGNEFGENGHGADTYKKPNHPTFSDESKYHGVDGNFGGKWQELPAGFGYIPSEQNKTRNLQGYFNDVEPETILMPSPWSKKK